MIIIRDAVQSFGKIRYLVSIQDSLTPLPPILYEYKIANFPETLDRIPQVIGIFPSRVSGRGYNIGPVCLCVCPSVS